MSRISNCCCWREPSSCQRILRSIIARRTSSKWWTVLLGGFWIISAFRTIWFRAGRNRSERCKLAAPAIQCGMKLRAGSVLMGTLWVGWAAVSLDAKDLTAFELVAAGNQYVSEASKNHVVQIRSDKSVGSLVPEFWYVVYYDPSATLKAVEVKFGGGKEMEVKRPMRLLEPMRGNQRVLDSDKLKVDSDRALSIALAEPLLK